MANETKDEKLSRARHAQGLAVSALERAHRAASNYKATAEEIRETLYEAKRAADSLDFASSVLADWEKMHDGE